MCINDNSSKYIAIQEIRNRFGSMFGVADGIFAGHPSDEGRAREIREIYLNNDLTLVEVTEIALGYFHRENFSETLRNEQLLNVIAFFSEEQN